MKWVFFHLAFTAFNLSMYLATGHDWYLFTTGLTTAFAIVSLVHYLEWRNFM